MPEVGEEGGAGGTVQDTVVDGQSQCHGGACGEFAVADHKMGLCGADGRDRGLGRVDDRGEVVDAVGAKVADGEGAAAEVLQ